MSIAAAFNENSLYDNLFTHSEVLTNKTHLRLLSYNIQVGVASSRFRHYVTGSWKHILPHAASFDNLDRISQLLLSYDIVALQEVDAGSLRSHFVNQVEYLAHKSHFPFWYHQTNRDFGKFAQASNGFLSKIRPSEIHDHKLPGFIPGRGAIAVRYGHKEHSLVLLLVHLALGRRARIKQLSYLSELASQFPYVVMMGDLNCGENSKELQIFLEKTNLSCPAIDQHTFPSWKPICKIDHILVTPSLEVCNTHVLNHAISDHLPISVEIKLPAEFNS